MNTPSHFLITAALAKIPPIRRIAPASALLYGSIAPDVPLYLLTIGTVITSIIFGKVSVETTLNQIFDVFYFNNIFWISSHNLLHAPIPLIAGGAILYCVALLTRNAISATRRKLEYRYNPTRIGGSISYSIRWLGAFLSSCGLHATIDILTHHDDGPLLLFPFEFTTRFISPISYWDPRHGGEVFTIFEFTLDTLIIIFLIVLKIKNRDNKLPKTTVQSI